jgi:hypothetical protein
LARVAIMESGVHFESARGLARTPQGL